MLNSNGVKKSERNPIASNINELKSKEAYLGGGSHMVLRVSWGPGGVLVSTEMAGFRVPGAVGEL